MRRRGADLPDYGLNCFELFLYAGLRTGDLAHADIARLYPAPRGADGRVVPAWFDEVAVALAPGGTSTFEPGRPDETRLRRGDLVFWDTYDFPIEHVAMLTGDLQQAHGRRSPEVYSFVNADDSGVIVPGPAEVVRTNIDQLTEALLFNGERVKEIRVGRGCW
jgi:cell wall-associated NlpC family hydrolase